MTPKIEFILGCIIAAGAAVFLIRMLIIVIHKYIESEIKYAVDDVRREYQHKLAVERRQHAEQIQRITERHTKDLTQIWWDEGR